jgi:integrase
MVEQSPFDKGGRLFLKENNQRLRYLSQDEIKRLLAECPIPLRWIVECAIHTGMRKGEILTLKWSQIRDGQIYLQKTKTNEPRQIPINDDLAALFKEIQVHQQFKSECVFPLERVNKGFKAALSRAGIQDFRFHDLRHTFASHLLMRGGALKDVQEILGHKTMTMTLRYAHLSGEHKRRAVNLLNGLTQTHSLDGPSKTVSGYASCLPLRPL